MVQRRAMVKIMQSMQSMAVLGRWQPDIRRCKECMSVICSSTFRARPKRESKGAPVRTLAICFLVAGARSQSSFRRMYMDSSSKIAGKPFLIFFFFFLNLHLTLYALPSTFSVRRTPLETLEFHFVSEKCIASRSPTLPYTSSDTH